MYLTEYFLFPSLWAFMLETSMEFVILQAKKRYFDNEKCKRTSGIFPLGNKQKLNILMQYAISLLKLLRLMIEL